MITKRLIACILVLLFSLPALAKEKKYHEYQGGQPLAPPLNKEVVILLGKVAKEFTEAAYVNKDKKRVDELVVKNRTKEFQAYLDFVNQPGIKAEGVELGPVSAAGTGEAPEIVRCEVTLKDAVTRVGGEAKDQKIYVRVRKTDKGFQVHDVEVP